MPDEWPLRILFQPTPRRSPSCQCTLEHCTIFSSQRNHCQSIAHGRCHLSYRSRTATWYTRGFLTSGSQLRNLRRPADLPHKYLVDALYVIQRLVSCLLIHFIWLHSPLGTRFRICFSLRTLRRSLMCCRTSYGGGDEYRFAECTVIGIGHAFLRMLIQCRVI